MMPCWHFLAYMELLEVTLVQPSFLDRVIPSWHITPGPLLISRVHHSLTGLLVTLSLPCHSYFKALLTRSAILLAKVTLPHLVRAIPPLLSRGSSANRVPWL